MISEELKMRRKEAVKAIIDSPLFSEAVSEVMDVIRNEIFATPVGASIEREALYFEAKAVERVLGRFRAYSGDVAMNAAKERKDAARK